MNREELGTLDIVPAETLEAVVDVLKNGQKSELLLCRCPPRK
jgi:hypothetical protein